MKTQKQKIGKIGEDIAAKYLISHDFKVIYRNYRIKFGEIDIIAKKNQEIIFVEVKTRKKVIGNMFGFPEEAVDKRKLTKISNTGIHFLHKFQYSQNTKWRIDIISIELNWKTRIAKIKHIKNAV